MLHANSSRFSIFCALKYNTHTGVVTVQLLFKEKKMDFNVNYKITIKNSNIRVDILFIFSLYLIEILRHLLFVWNLFKF